MNESEERWERMERTMEFLLQSDARLSARLDTMGVRLDTMGDRLDTMGDRLDTMGDRLDTMVNRIDTMVDRIDTMGRHVDSLTATVERQQVSIDRLAHAVDSMQIETRDAIGRMLEIAEGIAATAVTFSERMVDHERRIRQLENRIPPESA